MGQVLTGCEGNVCHNAPHKSNKQNNRQDADKDELMFVELERALGLHEFLFTQINYVIHSHICLPQFSCSI